MSSVVVLGFFANRDEARSAAVELNRRRFPRAALLLKHSNGSLETWDPFSRRRLVGASLSIVIWGGLLGLAAIVFAWRLPFLPLFLSVPAISLAGSMAALVVARLWFRRDRFGVERRLLRDHARRLVADESLLILQCPLDAASQAAAILRESGEVPPVLFFFHPERPAPPGPSSPVPSASFPDAPRSLQGPSDGAALSLPELEAHARRLAADHRLHPRPPRSTELLRRLDAARRWIHQVSLDLAAAARLDQGPTPIAEWILDNEYIIEANARDVRLNLPRRYYQELPALANGHLNLPRIYSLATELTSHADARLERDNIVAFLEAYQTVHPLTIGELWAYPQMLRIALIEDIQAQADRALVHLREREVADYWANRLLTVSRRDPTALFGILAELTAAHPSPTPYFAAQLVDHLYDEDTALAPVQGWLERVFRKPLAEVTLKEQTRQSQAQTSVSNAFTSLRQLAMLDWRQVFEDLSHVERILRRDPAGVYAYMDFDTRDLYRRAVESLAHGSRLPETQVAKAAVEAAAAALPDPDAPVLSNVEGPPFGFIGTYLIGEARRAFARSLGRREDLRYLMVEAIRARPALVYFAAAGLFSAALTGVTLGVGLGSDGLPSALAVGMALIALIPVSQLALKVTDYLVTRLLPPRTLPKMDFSETGIPDEFRTLIVVPEMLVSPPQIAATIERLEIRYLANREDNLLFALFTDNVDADQAVLPEDEALFRMADERITALNQRYPDSRFFFLHRRRRWSESEQKYIGWERKRGKLEELNHLIQGTHPHPEAVVHVGDSERLTDVRFVITLDSDTQLPSGTARRMIETAAHPLVRPRFDRHGRVAPGSYTILQPRVTPSLPSANATPFSRLFTDAVGIDPYTKAVSDVNQDLIGEGSYHGKGLYDVRAFSRVLSGRFPDEHLLSHDLIEGAHVRVALVSDLELLDEFPADYLTYCQREHRWIRGDWQIADWIFPRVPLRRAPPAPAGVLSGAEGEVEGPNPLSGFNRWKIFDNLRRSLVPVANVGLLVAVWLFFPQQAWLAAALVALQVLFQPLSQPLTWVTTAQGMKHFSLKTIFNDLSRAVAEVALLPHKAGLALDAIGRVVYRRLVSHRDLLEWTSARSAAYSALSRTPSFLLRMTLASVFSLAVGLIVMLWRPSTIPAAAPWLILWFVSPALGWLLTRRPRPRSRLEWVTEGDQRFLRTVARRTWGYFGRFVNEDTSWLPPDNYQISHRERVALRTSPTNIGMWLLSALAAHDFGYLTADQVIERLSRTLATVGGLERHAGHLLNWYDLETLSPLEPRYVSAVDSGNLLAALWTLRQGLEEMIRAPLLTPAALGGLRDTVDVVVEEADGDLNGLAGEARRLLGNHPSDVLGAVRALRAVVNPVHELAIRRAEPLGSARDGLRRSTPDESATADNAPLPEDRHPERSRRAPISWADELNHQLEAWTHLADRYLTWIEILAEDSDGALATLDAEARSAIRADLAAAPSLERLAHSRVRSIEILRRARNDSPPEALASWIDRVLADFDRAKWLAGEMLAVAEKLVRDVVELAESIDMRFLYDPVRRLFVIGHNVSAGRRDTAYYDLLASEARLGSYAAIAAGQVPIEHWFSMSRPYNAVAGKRVLLSWSGTMFEYLMPLLLQRSTPNSLLDQAVADSAEIQIGYGRRRGVPWGISESAYGDLDQDKNYQYKAFGVPELGLKRDLEQEVVVAPYATLLALAVAPRRAVRNLRRLADLGLLNDFGFFEAMDFSRRPRRRGERGVIVRAYMAHHQGMGLLALANLLHGNRFPRRFHADARVRSVEPLLHERIPTLPPLHHISTREGVPTVESVGEEAPSVSRFDTPHTATPKTQLLSNGRYGLMVTNAGGGYSQWGDLELTRWRSDPTRDSWGTFCYLHEADGRRLWSNTYHPVGGKVEGYQAHFALDRAVFRREDAGIHCETEMLVSPEDDVEIRRLTLINRSLRTRTVDLTTYFELSLAPHNADRQHPAFNKLFVQTEVLREHGALLAYRRARAADDPPVFVAHRLTPGDDAPLQFETDRRVFIGRGRTLRDPMGAAQAPRNTQGYVLDPVLSLRRSLTLAPGERRQVSLVLAASETREGALGLMTKYSDPAAVERAMDVAWASAQLELRVLRIQPDDARRFQKLAANLLYPNDLLRPSADRVEERNRKGQSGLWPYGISGDLPIALVSISEARDVAFVRQMLQAHSYLRAHGLRVDLLILNEEAAGYEQPLRERLEGLVRLHSLYTGIDKPGGVFLRSADQMPEEDRTLLLAASSVVMVAARGPLAQQLGVPAEPAAAAAVMVKKKVPRQPSAPLPFMELPYFNSLGGFSGDGREYVIYLAPESHTPAPWVNVIANPDFGTVVSETGAGFTWSGNSQRNRLTPWSNDPVLDTPGEAIYLRDEETGEVWTPTARPIRGAAAFRARHGAGYSVFEHNRLGIEQELTVFVPTDADGGEPVKVSRLRLKNDSPRPRRLSLTYYVEWALGEAREATQLHVVTNWDADAGALLARNRFHPEVGGRVAFAALSRAPDSYTADRASFLGRNRALVNPAAMEHEHLSRRTGQGSLEQSGRGAGIDPCAALRVAIDLAPGETTDLACLLGQVDTVDQAHELVAKYREGLAVEVALDRTKAWWDEILGAVRVETPEPSADFLVNRWLLYQTVSCRLWGRSAVYQSGGAFGFRDQLQDVLATLYARPALAREHILLAASRQFLEGDVQHWWQPPTGRRSPEQPRSVLEGSGGGTGIRTRISDDMLWLPYVTAEYVRITGDTDILHTVVPFLDGPTLADDQHDLFLTPEASIVRASLFEHCVRAVKRGSTSGPLGLPLIGTGDWNDGMDRVGAGGKGESVWLAWFLADVLEKMAGLAEVLGRAKPAQAYREQRAELIRRIDDVAWDGKWYRRATFDDGTPLGSSSSTEAKIDLLPQAWAWLTGGGDLSHAASALDAAWKHLVRRDTGLVLLFDPPFDTMEPTPGYIRGYPPGVRENGGQYTHAAMWLAMALARRGDGRRAVEILRMLNPLEHARDVDGVWRYGVEPYAVAADVYHAPGRVGQGGWSWYTGSAAWMYRAWVEEVLGLKVRGETLRLDPVIPPEWPGFRLTYRHGEAIYEIQVENPDHATRGVVSVQLDGRPIEDGVIPLERDLVKHRLVVRLGVAG